MALCVSVLVCHSSVFCWNTWTVPASFWHESFLCPFLHCVLRKLKYLQNKITSLSLTLSYWSLNRVINLARQLDAQSISKLDVWWQHPWFVYHTDSPPLCTASCCHTGSSVAADTCLVLTVLTQNITLGLDPIILSSLLRIARLLNVILLLGCLLKTFIDIFDIMFLSLLSYVLTFLFNMYCLLFTVISSRLTSCN